MLEQTWQCAARLAGERRVITVIDEGCRLDARKAPLSSLIVEQPCGFDTAPGIFLALSYVMAEDPEATVLTFLPDHFMEPKDLFASYMEEAAGLAERLCDYVILTAAEAERARTDHGWIQPGRSAAACGRASSVLRFHDKHDAAQAEFHRCGYLWNTLNLAVKGRTLWSMGWKHTPAIMDGFEALRAVIGLSEEADVLRVIYDYMKPINFSKGLLEKVVDKALVLPMDDILWTEGEHYANALSPAVGAYEEMA